MIFGQKMKLIIIIIIKHHNSKHYIHSIFINAYDNYPCLPKFEHHSIASGGYHSVRSLAVLVLAHLTQAVTKTM
jgi:hypothetical protein